MKPIGFGCMRLSTLPDRDPERAAATLGAALDAGATLLDTAPSYGLGEGDEHANERLIASVLAARPDRERVTVATKGGLIRRGKAWLPDGRARSLVESCERSLRALDRSVIDLYLLHTPDPKTPLATSVRALEGLRRSGLVKAIGLCNVSLAELESARELAEIAAIQIALGPLHDEAAQSGLLRRAIELGLLVIAHSPLGGARRVRALGRDPELERLSAAHASSPAALTSAWLSGLHPSLVPIPGSTRPEHARELVHWASRPLPEETRAALDRRFAAIARAFDRAPLSARSPRPDSEIVIVMGIQGAGKSEWVMPLVAGGHQRLNRDERGGTLRGLALELDRRLAASHEPQRFVLDNTYATRALRSHVLDVGRARGVSVRCVWLDTPLEHAQINLVSRLLGRYGRLPSPDELRQLGRSDPNAIAPTTQFRYLRELEPPAADEGFSAIERVAFERREAPSHDRAGVVLSLEAARRAGELVPEGAPALAFGWSPERSAELIEKELGARIAVAVCPHPGGPPRCWCRPPLPGLIVEWMLRERISPARSLFVGNGAPHARLARALGFRYEELG